MYWKPSPHNNDKNCRGNTKTSEGNSPLAEPSTFSKELEILQKLISQAQLSAHTPSHASGINVMIYKLSMSEKRKLSDWILDLGATDHITGDEVLFESLKSCYKNSTVRIADGSLSNSWNRSC